MQNITQFISECSRKHFVFVFGAAASGKTLAIASMLRAMRLPTVSSRLEVVRSGFFLNDEYLNHIDHSMRELAENNFPFRTTGRKNWLQVTRVQDEKVQEELVFWEFSNEYQLPSLESSDLSPEFALAAHISKKNTFILTIEANAAKRDDRRIEDFLRFLVFTLKVPKHTQIVLLITKWDTASEWSSIAEVLNRELPFTTDLINQIKTDYKILLQGFSIGSVTLVDNIPFIYSLDLKYAERLIETITQTQKKVKKQLYGLPPFMKKFLYS